MLLLAAGIAGGIFVAGCSGRDVRQEGVATVNGETIRVGELRESLGVPAGVFAVTDIPVERKKEALDRLVTERLLAQEGRSLGLDNTQGFRETLQRMDPLVRINALVRKEIEAKLKVTDEEIKEKIARVKEADKGITDADAAMRAVKLVSGSRVKKIREELIAAAKKEAGAEADRTAASPNGKEGDASGDGILAERERAVRALTAYAKKQGIDGSEGYRSIRQEMERSVLREMVLDNVAGKNVAVTDREVEAEFARNAEALRRRGIKVTAGMAAQIKEGVRANLLLEKRKTAADAYIDALRKKAKITVNDAILPKV